MGRRFGPLDLARQRRRLEVDRGGSTDIFLGALEPRTTAKPKPMLLLAGFTFLFLAALSPPLRGQDQLHPEFFLSGMVAMTVTEGDKGARERNDFRRGDNALGHLRFTAFGDVVFNQRFTLLNQIILDPATRPGLNSFLRTYLRYTLVASPSAPLHLQVGRLPTGFGSFAPRAYADRNPLMGLPLLYSYFTTLRSNQLPADNDDLLRHRGRGLAAGFTGYQESTAPNFNGLPLVYDACWDFGVQALGSVWRFEYLVGITQGTLSDPRTNPSDNNDGKQLLGRLAFVPRAGAVVGASFARGPYLDDGVATQIETAGADVEDFEQIIYGLDLEYGIRHFQLIAEFASNTWQAATLNAGAVDLKTVSWYVEISYKLKAGLTAAARYGRLDFGKITSGSGRRTDWEYDVGRSELGLHYLFTDGVIGKAVWQRHVIDQPGARKLNLGALQLVTSF